MARASSSIDIAASADEVWSIVGGFGSLPRWLAMVPSSTLEDGGRVRRLGTIDGATIIERLLAFDERGRRYVYCHVEAPDPVTDYESELRVEAVSDATSHVTWMASFTPVSITDAEAVARYEGIYGAGLAGLKRLMEQS